MPQQRTGAKYTKSRRPVTLAYYEAFETKQEAMKREYAIKQLPRKKKEELISHGCNMDLCMVAEDQVYATTDTSSYSDTDLRP